VLSAKEEFNRIIRERLAQAKLSTRFLLSEPILDRSIQV
jgi:hypothetical protein